MREEFFAKEVNEVLSDIVDYCTGIYDDILFLHNMTGWTYEELADKVSRNCDYFSIADIFRYFADAEMKQKQQNGSWNKVTREGNISF